MKDTKISCQDCGFAVFKIGFSLASKNGYKDSDILSIRDIIEQKCGSGECKALIHIWCTRGPDTFLYLSTGKLSDDINKPVKTDMLAIKNSSYLHVEARSATLALFVAGASIILVAGPIMLA